MGDSYLESSNLGRDLIRSIFAFLDRPAYWLLGIAYQLFFNVASADIFSNNTIMKFYGRVQVILGVFMMFQLAMVFLRGIIEPDSFSKDKGGGSFLRRVAMSLILITLLMPISITSPRNEYEKQINNNGLLFGTLYSLQHRILSNNTIGRLVLGTGASDTAIDGDPEKLETSANVFSSTILKGFYRINLIPAKERTSTGTKDPATLNKNRVCQDMDKDSLNAYTKLDADPGDIIAMVNKTCTVDRSFGNLFLGEKKYYFTYMPLISTIVAIIFVFILLSFTIDIAVRAIKLAVLRLIAPIPLISYMDPKGSGDEAFKSWSKTLTSTYLDLFIRLAVVYFVIFIIQDMIINGIVINNGSGVIGVISLIIIWIGLFVFAKNSDKFIKQVLGLKDSSFNIMSGFTALSAAAGMGAAAVGTIGSARASARASRMADETRKSFGENVNPDSFWNKGKHILAGIGGGFAGGAAGMKAAFTAKDHGLNASLEAMRKRNVDALDRGNNGTTFMGRMGSVGRNIFSGEGQSTNMERIINSLKGRKDAAKEVKSRMASEMVKSFNTTGDLGIKDAQGDEMRANYKTFMGALNAAKAAGQTTVTFRNTAKDRDETITVEQAEVQQGFLLKNNEDNYVRRMTGYRSGNADEDKYYTLKDGENVDQVLISRIHNFEALGGSAKFERDENGNIKYAKDPKTNKDLTGLPVNTRSSINDAIDGFDDMIAQFNRQNAINKANDRYSGGKK